MNVNESNDLDKSLPDELKNLSTLLDNPETLAAENAEIRIAALNAAKYIFDHSVNSEENSRPHVLDLISSLTQFQAPQTRSKAKAEAEKPFGENANQILFDPTPLKSLFIDGMDDGQIWAQLDLRTRTICCMLDYVLEGEMGNLATVSEETSEDDDNLSKALEGLKAVDDITYEIDEGELGDSQSEGSKEVSSPPADVDQEMEDISPLRDPSSDEEDDSIEFYAPPKLSKKRKRGNTSQLDDRFFDLSEFNAYTERVEAKSSSRGRLAGSDSDGEDDGIDLFARIGSIANEEEDHDPGEIFYSDFFEPPSKIPKGKPFDKLESNNDSQVRFHGDVRVKKIKATGKNRPLFDDDLDEEDEDMLDEEEDWQANDNHSDQSDEDSDDLASSEELDEESSGTPEDDLGEGATIQRFKHDLFAEEEEENGDLTTHEKRMQSLQEQISQLESENVAQKDWMLVGEAGSRQRPQNSLLEEDVEFDRVRKVAPVITEEVVRSLEEKIKARILEGRFDDVIRRRPLEDKVFLPSKLLELQDTKSKQSLAQIYEAEYIASKTDGSLPDDRDGRLKKEHDEITILWERICNKLDALSNAHYMPKQPKAMITTVTNAPTVMMESALPTSKSVSTMLSPEEVFTSSSSSLKARSELTPTEHRARRNKERKLKKRERDSVQKKVDDLVKSKSGNGVKQQKKAALDSLVKHGKGVTVVGKESISQNKRKKK